MCCTEVYCPRRTALKGGLPPALARGPAAPLVRVPSHGRVGCLRGSCRSGALQAALSCQVSPGFFMSKSACTMINVKGRGPFDTPSLTACFLLAWLVGMFGVWWRAAAASTEWRWTGSERWILFDGLQRRCYWPRLRGVYHIYLPVGPALAAIKGTGRRLHSCCSCCWYSTYAWRACPACRIFRADAFFCPRLFAAWWL